MPENKILLEPCQMYHIWTHANGDENLFRDEENYTYFLERYSYYILPVADTFAYCMMPNHLHLMVRVKEEEEVLEFLRVKKSNPNPNLKGFENLGGFSRVISQQFSNLFLLLHKIFQQSLQSKRQPFYPELQTKADLFRQLLRHPYRLYPQ